MVGYNENAIKNICRNKIDDLYKHIKLTDANLANKFKHHCFISGGAITSLLLGETPNDFDIYIDDIDVLYDLCKFYTDQWNNNHKSKKLFTIVRHLKDDSCDNNSCEIRVVSVGIVNEDDEEYNEEQTSLPSKETIEDIDTIKNEQNDKYVVRCITSNAISLSNDVQIICRFCGKPEEIFKNYDFVHTMQAYVRKTDILLLNNKSLLSIMSKRLEYQGSLFPVCSMFRIRKFLARGWTISAMEMLKIAYQISKLNLDDVIVLKEQCLGCDFFYLLSFIKSLEEWRQNNPNVEFNNEYMFELMKKVFDKDYSLGEE